MKKISLIQRSYNFYKPSGKLVFSRSSRYNILIRPKLIQTNAWSMGSIDPIYKNRQINLQRYKQTIAKHTLIDIWSPTYIKSRKNVLSIRVARAFYMDMSGSNVILNVFQSGYDLRGFLSRKYIRPDNMPSLAFIRLFYMLTVFDAPPTRVP